MFCTQCRTKNVAEAKFCFKCGTQIDAPIASTVSKVDDQLRHIKEKLEEKPDASEPSAHQDTDRPAPNPQEAPEATNNSVILLMLLAVAIAGIYVFAYYLPQKTQEAEEQRVQAVLENAQNGCKSNCQTNCRPLNYGENCSESSQFMQICINMCVSNSLQAASNLRNLAR